MCLIGIALLYVTSNNRFIISTVRNHAGLRIDVPSGSNAESAKIAGQARSLKSQLSSSLNLLFQSLEKAKRKRHSGESKAY